MNIKSISTVSDKGLTTIPKSVRKKLNIKKGDKIHWILTEKDKSDLVIIHKPLEFLTGRHAKKNITYEKLEHVADDIILNKVKKESQ